MPELTIHEPTKAAFSLDGLNPPNSERLDAMKQLLAATNGVEASNIAAINVTNTALPEESSVLIPIHKMDSRSTTMATALHSLERQDNPQSLQAVIVWNGKSEPERRELEELVNTIRLKKVIITDAPPSDPSKQTAAHARNVGLKKIESLAAEDPSFRGGIFLMDSDTALMPGSSIKQLANTLIDNPMAAVVTANTVQVPLLNKGEYYKFFLNYLRVQKLTENGLTPFDTLLTPQGQIQIENIVGWGSTVAAKTCGAFLSRRVLEKLTAKNTDLFVSMPYGSSEDMFASVALSSMGVILHNANVILLDQTRETPEGTRKQRGRWGADHVHLFHHLREIHKTRPGLQVLEPLGNGWTDWKVPQSEGVVDGIIINPNQLRWLAHNLETVIADEGIDKFQASFSFPIAKPEIDRGLAVLRQFLDIIEETRHDQSIKTQVRRDLPPPRGDLFSPTIPRYSKDALTSLLLGNIRGMFDIQKIHDDLLPKEVMFGVRQ